jgi:hypothetical protein
MPGGLRDHRAGGEDVRSLDDALVDRGLQGEGRTAGVAHRREAAHQRRAGLPPSDQVQEGRVLGQRRDLGRRDQRRMPVAVDEPGDHGPAAAIDDLRLGRPLTARDQRCDAPVLDQDVEAVPHGRRLAVEERQVGQKQRPSRRLGADFARRETEAREEAQHRARPAEDLAAADVGLEPAKRGLRLRRPAEAGVHPESRGHGGITCDAHHEPSSISYPSTGWSHGLAMRRSPRSPIRQPSPTVRPARDARHPAAGPPAPG